MTTDFRLSGVTFRLAAMLGMAVLTMVESSCSMNRAVATSGYHLSGYWDANVAYWRANRWLDVPGNHKNLAVIGITPVFRWEADDKLGFYADAGIGAALFSSVYRNTHRQLSTAYEFADHVGVGYVFANKWELGVRIQHYSNGGIKHPNGGVNLAVLKAAYHF